MSTLSDDERIDAIGDGWSEIYREQDEAEAERLGAWCCPVDRMMVPLGENCSECGCHPSSCECPDCEQDEQELEYMPLWATIAGPLERLHDEWDLEGTPEQVARRQALIDSLRESVAGWGKAIHRATIDALSDEWTDEHERDDSEGWDDET